MGIKNYPFFYFFLFQIHSQGRGELLISLCYQPAANRLTVVVLKARNLPKMDITGLSGTIACVTFVDCFSCVKEIEAG